MGLCGAGVVCAVGVCRECVKVRGRRRGYPAGHDMCLAWAWHEKTPTHALGGVGVAALVLWLARGVFAIQTRRIPRPRNGLFRRRKGR